ncbi:MAG TPA: DUF6282 family protein [Dehalococcoidia bacterium]|nr:DUF6282 family protein [Dehalococcoidia bacterium]
MADKETVHGLLRGAIDMHVHSAPDVLPRKFDDVVLAQRTIDSGMAGFVLKSHYICTADRATMVRAMFPQVQAFGALTLNNSVGGLNPIAVDIAGRLGNKVVWLPTVDSQNELENIAGQRDESKLPYWMSIAREMRQLGIAGNWIRMIDDNGKVIDAAMQCLELIARHDMVLATGHISLPELRAVVKAAHELKVQRIIITHAEFPTTFLTIDQHRELQPYGVYFERCFTTPYTGKVAWETVVENIKQVGAETTIISTDLGQTTNPYVDEGLEIYFGKLLDAGISERQIERMVRDNPANLLAAAQPAKV